MTYDMIAKAAEFSRDFELAEYDDDMVYLLVKTLDFLFEEVRETERAASKVHMLYTNKESHSIDMEGELEEIVDGFGDVAFVALNGIYKTFRWRGNNHDLAVSKTQEVVKRICEANLNKKHPDGTVKKINGKVQKPEGWSPPHHKDLLKTGT